VSKLSRAKLQKIIKEELQYQKSKAIWENEIRPSLNETRNRLLSEGYTRQTVDENFAKQLFGGLMKLAGGETADQAGLGGSESLFGDLASGIRTTIEQTAIEKIVRMLSLDPYSGFGLVLKNAIEQSVKQLSADEIMSLASGEEGKCMPVAEKLTSIVMASIEESLKETLLNAVMNAVLGELGADFRDNSFTKPIYQNIREKFSDSFAMMMQDPVLHSELATTICQNLNISGMLGDQFDDAKEAFGAAASDVGEQFSDAVSNIGDLNPLEMMKRDQ